MEKEKYRHLIFNNALVPLSTVDFHKDTSCIERYYPNNFPMHVAIHKITNATNVEKYTMPHQHDTSELNIFIGDEGGLEYSVQLGDETYTICSNSSVWIPKNLNHSTNVIKGSGYYIAIRLNDIPENL